MAVSVTSDMGESFGIHTFGHDDDLLPLIDTANVACGFHAGDPVGIHETVAKAAAQGVSVGAHPGLPDPVGFGRREMKLFPDEVRDLVLYQVGALVAFLDAEGLALDHLKPHGSLYGHGRDGVPGLHDAPRARRSRRARTRSCKLAYLGLSLSSSAQRSTVRRRWAVFTFS